MKPTLGSYVLIALWAVWFTVATALLVALGPAPAWVPDLLLVVLVSVSTRASLERARLCALLFALFRAALGSDPLAAVAAGYLAWVEFQARLARVFDLQAALARGTLAVIAGWLVGAWLLFVRSQRAPLPMDPGGEGAFAAAWPAALSAGVVAAALGGMFAGLPGLSALKERSWEAAGPSR